MKTISLKLDETIFQETEKLVSEINKARNRYINEAIDHYNKVQKRKLLEEKLLKESELVKENSIKILKEFEKIED